MDKIAFINEYKDALPTATPQEINEAWQEAREEKRQQRELEEKRQQRILELSKDKSLSTDERARLVAALGHLGVCKLRQSHTTQLNSFSSLSSALPSLSFFVVVCRSPLFILRLC
jgi:hypothetical protein